jgi:hypothetical protein
MNSNLIVDIIKVGALTLVISKVSKVIGQKDIAEIIAGIGLLIVGTDVIILITPICKGIVGFNNSVSNAFNSINQFFQMVAKFTHMG